MVVIELTFVNTLGGVDKDIMEILHKLIQSLPDGKISRIGIGLNWTFVAAETRNKLSCGLAATQKGVHEHSGEPSIPWAGAFEGMSAQDLASMVLSERTERVSLGMATINALVEHPEFPPVERNADSIIAEYGENKKVALIGHFPFVEQLREKVGELFVLEQNPQQGDYHANDAPRILPQADVVAITAMTLMNGTFDTLLSLCSSKALVLMLGPSTPLSPLMFEYVDIMAGSIVERIEPVAKVICEGGNFRQVHRAGVKLVTYFKPGLV